mgnify:CR=1 FL=1
MSSKYVLRMIFRGSGNLKRYLIMLAVFEAIFLSLTTAPAGYLNETLQLIPKPSLWASLNPPGIEVDYSYLEIRNEEFLIISSPDLSEATKLLTGRKLKLNEVSIGCWLRGSKAEEYLRSKWGHVATLTCTNTFLDYSIILDRSIFKQVSKSSYFKIYLRASSQNGIAIPSAWNLANDLVALVRLHRNLLSASLTIILSIICCILGLRSTSDLREIIESLEEVHIPRSTLLLNLSIIAVGTMLIGVLTGYGLTSVITPLALIYLRQMLGIPYIYTAPSPLTMISTLPLALISLTCYLVPIVWRFARK